MVSNTRYRFGEIHTDWPIIRLRQVMRQRREWISVSDQKEYTRVTARCRNQGIELRDNVLGTAIKTKRQQVVHTNDLLVAEIDAKVGGIGIIPPSLDGGIVSSHYFVFELDGAKMDHAWLDQIVRAGWLQRQVDAVGSTNYAAVRPDDVMSFQLPLPPLPEQRAIADTLAAMDETIARTQAVIEQLRVAKYWQMREFLTLGHPRFRTTLQPITEPWPVGRVAPDITMMPQHWHLVTLTDVARLESGHTPSREHPEYWDGDIPWISLQDTDKLADLVITETAEMVTEEGIANSSARILPKDTVVFSRTASVGLCSRMGAEMATSQDFANYICGPDILPAYLVQLFRSMSKEWDRLQEGSTHKTIYMPVFKRMKIFLPSTDEQRAIADIGEAYDLRIKAETAYMGQLTEAKRGLAQGLLSGTIRCGAAVV